MDLKRGTRHSSANGSLGPMLLVLVAIEGYQPLLLPGLARPELLWEGSTQKHTGKERSEKVWCRARHLSSRQSGPDAAT